MWKVSINLGWSMEFKSKGIKLNRKWNTTMIYQVISTLTKIKITHKFHWIKVTTHKWIYPWIKLNNPSAGINKTIQWWWTIKLQSCNWMSRHSRECLRIITNNSFKMLIITLYSPKGLHPIWIIKKV